MIVKLLTEHYLEFLSLKGGCRGLSESTHVKMPHCWKSHATAQIAWKKGKLPGNIEQHMFFSVNSSSLFSCNHIHQSMHLFPKLLLKSNESIIFL